MSRHFFLSIFIVFCSLISFASDDSQPFKVDINRINVERLSNPSKYDSMMSRYLAGDSTLTLDQMAFVYYGHAFGLDYDPTDGFDDVAKAYAERDYPTVWRRVVDAMKLNPVSLDLMIKALVAANNISDPKAKEMIPILRTRYELVSNLILSSGKGSTPESPFVVISEDDLDRIVRNVICVESILGRATLRNLDAVKVKLITSDRQHILYFDNSLQHNYEKNKRR